jgi:UDP-N-acetyl-D-glucosamine dehydrogenase
LSAEIEPAVVAQSDSLVVIGLGYVGLPLAREASKAGFKVTGYDTSAVVVAGLNSGRSHIQDVPDPDVQLMLSAGFQATTDLKSISAPGAVIICVPTPLGTDRNPDLSAVRAAAEAAGEIVGRGSIVVLESTTYPGTTDEIVRPIVEKISGMAAGTDFSLAFSPERIDPGNQVFGIRNTPKVVGGVTADCTAAGVALYERLCDTVIHANSAREAEMAKLLENTYRHVNIALVNEMARICHDLGIDLRDAIRCAATKPFGFEAFYPGPGVGGHCIPVDPGYLSHRVRTWLGYPFRLVDLAVDINESMPAYVAVRVREALEARGTQVLGARVLLMGVTYKKDCADLRETPATPLARVLRSYGAELSFCDPYVAEWVVDGSPVPASTDLEEGIANTDLAVLLQVHSAFDLSVLAKHAAKMFDTRGVVTSAERL